MEENSNQTNDTKASEEQKPKRYIKKKIFFLNKKRRHTNNTNNSNNVTIPKNDKNTIPKNIGIKKGRWTDEEHDKFLEGIILYGEDWKKIKTLVKSRNGPQIKSHSKKFYQKLKSAKDEIIGIDFTMGSINSIKDMIIELKKTNNNFIILNVLKYLSFKYNIYSNKKYNDNKLKDYLSENPLENKIETKLNPNENANTINDNRFINCNLGDKNENLTGNTDANNNPIINNFNSINNYIVMDRNDLSFILLNSFLVSYINRQMNNQNHNPINNSLLINNNINNNLLINNNINNEPNIIGALTILLLIKIIYENSNNGNILNNNNN